MDSGLGTSVAEVAAAVDPAELRRAQRRHCRRLLDEIEQIRAAESELAAHRYRLVAELSGDYPAAMEFVRNEVAPALNIPDVDAYQLVERARTLTMVLPETLAALQHGRIGENQATAVADAVDDTTPEVAAVVDRFAVAAMDNEPLTDRQVYRRAHRQVLKLDPPAAERQHRQQRLSRTLARRLSADGMATLRMYATAQDVAAVWDVCTVLADAAAAPGDERDLGNRRVDALVDLLTGILDTGRLPDDGHQPGPDQAGPAAGYAAEPADSGTPANDAEPGEAVGDTSGAGDDAAADSADLGRAGDDWVRWAEQFTDRGEPEQWDGVEGAGDPADEGAWTCPADLAAFFAAEDAWLAAATEVPPSTETRPPTTKVADPPPATDGTAPRNPLVRSTGRRPGGGSSVLMNVTVPINLLLGDHTAVAEIPGLGPITAGQVATLLDQATLRRILCDPISGEVLDVGRSRYTPTAAITRHVKTRDQTCVVPGCDQPAARCDIDHRQPFAAGGQTAASNLNVLCRHHHRAKDGGGFHLARTDQGWEWTTALGRTYTRPVTPLYEPGDNYWPLNIRQTDGYNPNEPTEPAAPKEVPPAPAAQTVQLPDDPPF